MYDVRGLTRGNTLAEGLAGDRHTRDQRGHDELREHIGLHLRQRLDRDDRRGRAGNDAADINHDGIAEAQDLFRIAQQVQRLVSAWAL